MAEFFFEEFLGRFQSDGNVKSANNNNDNKTDNNDMLTKTNSCSFELSWLTFFGVHEKVPE